MFHYCAHCDYRSPYRGNVKRHQRIIHRTPYDEVVEHPLPTQRDELPMDLELMEESIQVFKIFKLLQRMKDK